MYVHIFHSNSFPTSTAFLPSPSFRRQQIKLLVFLGNLIEFVYEKESRKKSNPTLSINCSSESRALPVNCELLLRSQQNQIEHCVYQTMRKNSEIETQINIKDIDNIFSCFCRTKYVEFEYLTDTTFKVLG